MSDALTSPSETQGSHRSDSHFPLALCCAATLVDSLGLPLVAFGVRWGAGVPAPSSDSQAFGFAWIYVHLFLLLTWFVLWPIAAFGRRRCNSRPVTQTAYDFAALLLAAIPPTSVAATLTGVPVGSMGPMMSLQLSMGICAGGIIAYALPRGRAMQALASGKLALLALGAPLMAYFCSEFFPAAWDGWFLAIPAFAVSHAARASAPDALFWCVAAGYGLAGMILIVLARKKGIYP